jgi:hypothetical protein
VTRLPKANQEFPVRDTNFTDGHYKFSGTLLSIFMNICQRTFFNHVEICQRFDFLNVFLVSNLTSYTIL